MLSPAAFQPKPEVSDLEMAEGVGLGDAGLLDEPSTERKVCAAFLVLVVVAFLFLPWRSFTKVSGLASRCCSASVLVHPTVGDHGTRVFALVFRFL